MLIFPFSSKQRQATKTTDDGHVKTKIIPPSNVERFVQANTVIEEMEDQGQWSQPTMPDTRKESGWRTDGIGSIAWYAST